MCDGDTYRREIIIYTWNTLSNKMLWFFLYPSRTNIILVFKLVFTIYKRSCGKVMFLLLSVILFTGGGVHPPRKTSPGRHLSRQTPPGRHPWVDIFHGRHPLGRQPLADNPWVDHPWANTPWADNPLGRHPPGQTHPLRWPLQQTVCILLECILVFSDTSSIVHSVFDRCLSFSFRQIH